MLFFRVLQYVEVGKFDFQYWKEKIFYCCKTIKIVRILQLIIMEINLIRYFIVYNTFKNSNDYSKLRNCKWCIVFVHIDTYPFYLLVYDCLNPFVWYRPKSTCQTTVLIYLSDHDYLIPLIRSWLSLILLVWLQTPNSTWLPVITLLWLIWSWLSNSIHFTMIALL